MTTSKLFEDNMAVCWPIISMSVCLKLIFMQMLCQLSHQDTAATFLVCFVSVSSSYTTA